MLAPQSPPESNPSLYMEHRLNLGSNSLPTSMSIMANLKLRLQIGRRKLSMVGLQMGTMGNIQMDIGGKNRRTMRIPRWNMPIKCNNIEWVTLPNLGCSRKPSFRIKYPTSPEMLSSLNQPNEFRMSKNVRPCMHNILERILNLNISIPNPRPRCRLPHGQNRRLRLRIRHKHSYRKVLLAGFLSQAVPFRLSTRILCTPTLKCKRKCSHPLFLIRDSI